MAKGDKDKVKEEINTEQKRVNEQFGALTSEMDQKRREKDEQSRRDRAALTGTLEGMAGTSGGLDPTVVNNIRGLYGGKTVGFDSGTSGGSSGGGGSDSGGSSGGTAAVTPPEDKWKEPKDIYSEFGKTGGVEMERMRSQITELENLAKTGAIDPAQKDSINATIQKLKDFQFDPAAKAQIQGAVDSLTQMGLTGGYDPNRLAQINADIDKLRQWSETGGVDADRLAKMRGTIDFMSGGGISAEDLERWRGTGYGEFAKTGGWSDAERADFRDRATSGIPAMYQQQMDEAQRQRNIQGGAGGAGFLAAAGRANRQGAQQLADARRNAEVDLGSQVREGRRWGITGLATTEKDIQSQYGLNRGAGMQAGNQLELGIGQNRIEGYGQAAKLGADLEKDISSNRIQATQLSGQLNTEMQNSINDAFIRAQQGAGTLETNLADAIGKNRVNAQQAAAAAEATAQKLRQEGQLAGAQGLMAVAAQKAAEAARAESNANAARANDQANERWWANFQGANERWIGEQQQQGQQFAVGQQRGLLGMDETLARDQFGVDTASQWAGANRGLLQTDVAANQGGGVDWAKWAQLGIGGANALNNANSRGDIKGTNPINNAGYPGTITGGGGGYDYSGGGYTGGNTGGPGTFVPGDNTYVGNPPPGSQIGGGFNPGYGNIPSDDQWWYQ